MTAMSTYCKSLLLFLIALGVLFPAISHAQCPSVLRHTEPPLVLINIYGIPHVNFFDFDQAELGLGFTRGLQMGVIISPSFHVVAGAEASSVSRVIDRGTNGRFNYNSRFVEVPVDMRMRVYHSKRDNAYFILGLGAVFSRVLESNDPLTVLNRTYYHQMYVRFGLDHGISVKQKFNFIWGPLLKVDPMSVIGESFSFINASYYAGLRAGIQFGL